ncbi:MAG: hypothetical protein ACM3TR_11605 [Caulobacteraceae bacterium]
MSPAVKRLLGQALIRTMIGDKSMAAELSAKARKIYDKEYDKEMHLYARIDEILKHKGHEIRYIS